MDASFFVAGVLVGALVLLLFTRLRRTDTPLATTIRKSETPVATTGVADQVLERLNEGVLLLGPDLHPMFMNGSARDLLAVQDSTLPARVPSEDVLVLAQRAVDEVSDVNQLITQWFPNRAKLHARAIQLPNGNVLVTLRDISEEVLAQQVRKEFVAHASHELKSPVASLQTLAEAVREAARDDPEVVSRFAERMVSEAIRLGRLVSDLLDLSRLEEAGAVPDAEVDLSKLVRRQADEMEKEAAAKNLLLERSISPDVFVRGDAQQIGLMVRNLLDNALRYTPESGSVSIEVKQSGQHALIRVVDTGMGIPLEAQSRVFERFYRIDRARSRDRGGTGLGLAIVKHVAELHGGTVSLQSELGEGSAFTANLPALPPGRSRSLAG